MTKEELERYLVENYDILLSESEKETLVKKFISDMVHMLFNNLHGGVSRETKIL